MPITARSSAASAEPAATSARIPRPGVIGWRDSVRAATATLRERPAVIGVGLLGFLARGGLVAFLLPVVALPTPIGISTFIGGTALTGSGASEGLVRLIALGIAIVAGAIALGTVLGAIADVLLVREGVAAARVLERGAVTDHRREAIRREVAAVIAVRPGLMTSLLLVRALTLLPVALAVAWGTTRLVAAGYHQLILPDNLTLPLGLRILIEALDAAVVVVAVWLGAELVGGIAVRQVIVHNRSATTSLVLAVIGLVRRPVTTAATFILGVAGLAIAAGPPLLLAAAMWSRLQAFLADDVAILLLLPATFIFVSVWGAGLLTVGVVASWRGILGTLDVVRAGPVNVVMSGPPDLDSSGLVAALPEVGLPGR